MPDQDDPFRFPRYAAIAPLGSEGLKDGDTFLFSFAVLKPFLLLRILKPRLFRRSHGLSARVWGGPFMVNVHTTLGTRYDLQAPLRVQGLLLVRIIPQWKTSPPAGWSVQIHGIAGGEGDPPRAVPGAR